MSLGSLRIVLGLLIGIFITACDQEIDWNSTDISGIMPDLSLALVNTEGAQVTEKDFTGKMNVVFFGYTFCPDICPATLAKLRMAKRQLSPEQQAEINVLFVSVDPDRDTPEHLKRYIGSFGPGFVGLTGTQEQLQSMVRRYRVTYGYGKPDEYGSYEVSHSSAIFVFDPTGNARLLAKDTMPTEALADDLRRVLETS